MVSVVMPAYNAEKYIEQAIRSVMKQTYTDWELLVIDDCSTDNTFLIVDQLAKEDSRIILKKNEFNIGVAKTRNIGFDLSSGQYLALLDSDDIWLEDKLLRQLELFELKDADIVYCSYAIIDEEGNRKCNDFIVTEQTFYKDALVRSVISCSTVMISREIYTKFRFDASFYHEDLVLWLKLLKDGYKAYGLAEVLAKYRVFHGTRSSNKFRSVLNRFIVYRHYLKLPLHESILLLIQAAIIGVKKYKPIKYTTN